MPRGRLPVQLVLQEPATGQGLRWYKPRVASRAIVHIQRVESKILLIRGQKVLLDADLAELYGVETKYLTRQVRRNIDRFPSDFMFVLTRQELTDLRRQIGTSSSWGGRRSLPLAFTEQGVAMLSSVLRSRRAVEVNILIMRAFVKLREMLATHEDLARKFNRLEKKYDEPLMCRTYKEARMWGCFFPAILAVSIALGLEAGGSASAQLLGTCCLPDDTCQQLTRAKCDLAMGVGWSRERTAAAVTGTRKRRLPSMPLTGTLPIATSEILAPSRSACACNQTRQPQSSFCWSTTTM